MSENKLKLNPDKTEFIVFGAKDRYKWLSDSFPVNILGNCLLPPDVVCNLGVLFDAKFCFTNHVNSVIKSVLLTSGTFFVSGGFSLLLWSAVIVFSISQLSPSNATRLQYVQNALARFVTGASKYTHITSSLRTFHWLPIRQ